MQDSLTGPRAGGRAFDAASADALPLLRRRGLLLGVLCAAVLGAVFLAAYSSTIAKLVAHWSNNDMYSYGFLVPAISGYLIWLRRDRLRDVPITPSFVAGVVVLMAGLSMLVVGRVSATNLVEELSLPVTVGGTALLVLGGRLTQSLTFPLVYLFTMIPFWDVFTGRLHLPFQLYSAAMGVGALRLLDIPVFNQGVFIELPNVTLEVAELCSGVNNLVAILCIGVPLTHYYVVGWPKRIFIVSTAALIALVSNGVRVAMVCLFAFYGIRGADGDIHGPYSLLRSLLISGVGFFVLFWLISRFADRPESEHPTPSDPGSVSSPLRVRGLTIVLAIGLTAAAGTFERWHAVAPVPLRTGLVGFPTTIGRWESHNRPSLADSLGSLDFDEKLLRGYAAPDGTEANLFLGYLARQTQGRELGGESLLSSLGLSRQASTSRLTGQGRVRDVLVSSGTDTIYVTYSYILDGRVIADDYEAKLRTTWNALADRRSNGAIVVVAAKVGSAEPIDAVRVRLGDFMEGALGLSAALLAGEP